MKQTYNIKYKIGDKVFWLSGNTIDQQPYEVCGISIHHDNKGIIISYIVRPVGYSINISIAEKFLFTTIQEAQTYLLENPFGEITY